MNKLVKKCLIAFLMAAVGCVATLLVQGSSDKISAIINKSPYSYLKGRYSGHWEWTDQNNQNPSETNDTVFIETVNSDTLSGRGSDSNLGTYKFNGNCSGKHLSAAYISDLGSNEPAQSGGFELDVSKTSPLTLTGTWTGFYDQKRIHGTAILTKLKE
jgi:hypothetical protein